MQLININHSHFNKISHLALLLCALFPLMTFAQFGNNPVNPPQNPRNTPSTTKPDSTNTDSVPKKNIAPNTRRIYPARFFGQDFDALRVKEDLATFHYWDELDTLQGVVNGLGLIGKPYRNSRFGVQDRWFTSDAWRNPLTDAPNVYLQNGETQAKYFDSKTPYIRLDFAQGPQRSPKTITLLDLTASFNVTSFWNLTAYYKRRQAESVYGGNTSDNRLVHLNSYFHTYKQRYQFFVNAQFNEFNNLFSGGVYRAYGSDESNAFIKGQEPINLSSARGRWNTKAVFADQYYHLIRSKDSTKLKQKLTLRNFYQYEYTNFDFIATSLNLASLQQNWFPSLPTFQDTSATEMSESFETNRLRVGAEANYAFNLKEYFEISIRGGVQYQQLSYIRKDSSYSISQNTFTQKVQGSVAIPKLLGLRYDLDFHTRPNNLFNPETYWENTFSLKLKGIQLSLHQLLHSQNPSLFQTYYKSGKSNAFTPNPNLKNQQLNHIRAQLRIAGKGKIWEKAAPKDSTIKLTAAAKFVAKDTLLNNYFYVQPFLSTISQAIYYDDTLHVRQAQNGANLTYTGIEIGGRYRFWRKMYVEGTICAQRGSVSDTADLFFTRYSKHLPNIYGKISCYYQNKTLYRGIMRLGIDASYNASYIADASDPISGEYYPTRQAYTMLPYPRVDIFFGTQIKRAYIFAKIINVTDTMFTYGNYTTPFYPVLPRTFSLGVNWVFFD